MKHQPGEHARKERCEQAMKKNGTKNKTTRKPTVKRKATNHALPRTAAEPTTANSVGKASKKQTVIDLLGQEGGATLANLMAATGWQAHSVRGFISGMLRKQLGLAIERVSHGDGGSRYRIALAAQARRSYPALGAGARSAGAGEVMRRQSRFLGL
jgi:hypothetical protein